MDELPSPALYNLHDVLIDADNEARIASQQIEAWNGYSLDISFEAGRKARWIRWGTFLLLAGLLGLLLSSMHPAAQPVLQYV